MQKIEAKQVKDWLEDGAEIAFLDVREHGQYGEGHPFLVVSAPYSRIEAAAISLVPRLSTRIVLLDGNDGVGDRAAARLQALGYSQVFVLDGGVEGWQAAGYGLFQGVNLPSKTFGELVEHHFHTPSVTASQLAAMQDKGDKLVVLDGRPQIEHLKMAIPNAICCPNGELAYRIHSLVEDETTPVIIHCAGRTRSIIGAQMLINLGLPNPVYALENGTQGWFIADFELDKGSERAYRAVSPSEPGLEINRARAQRQAASHAIARASAQDVADWRDEADRTVYVLDIRTPEEVAADPRPGAIHAPGGQLLQGTDQYVGTRRARLVLLDFDGVRAPVVASWLHMMGQEVYLLEPADYHPVAAPVLPAPLTPQRLSLADYAAQAGDVRLIDLRASESFRRGHLAGAQWGSRPTLASQLAGETRRLVFVADSADILGRAVGELPQSQRDNAVWLDGEEADWRQEGLALETMSDAEGRDRHIDYLFFVHDRHDGNKDAARQYLAWELGLIEKLDASERAIFNL